VAKAHDAFYALDVPEEGRKRNLLALSFAEVAERLQEPGQDVVLVPLGSTEKHGAHIPLGTDSYITMTAVVQAAELADCLYAPLVPFGYSPHHMARHRPLVNAAFARFFGTALPARTIVEVRGLNQNDTVELEAVAVRQPRSSGKGRRNRRPSW
jgi:hypothetical protein